MLKRVIAVLVLVLVAAIAIKLAVGLVVGVISAVLWIVVLAALVAAALWARSTLKSAKRARAVKRSPASPMIAAPPEDPVAIEMARIRQQLREQGRG
jgi:threonine/homoserine/homoserine lactone efflux protein